MTKAHPTITIQTFHTNQLRRIEGHVVDKMRRRFQHLVIVRWHLSAELDESRAERLLVTSKILSCKYRRELQTRIFTQWVMYCQCKRRIRAAERHVAIKHRLFQKRRHFREWKDVEWLKYFSSILERWYRTSMGQILREMQSQAMESLEKMWDRTVNSTADITLQLHAAIGSTNDQSRAVQFQDHAPFSSTSELMVSRKKARSSTPPKTKKSSRARSRTPPKAPKSASSVQTHEQSATARLTKGKDGGKAKVDKISGRLHARTAVALHARTMSLSSSTSAKSPRATGAHSTSSSRFR